MSNDFRIVLLIFGISSLSIAMAWVLGANGDRIIKFFTKLFNKSKKKPNILGEYQLESVTPILFSNEVQIRNLYTVDTKNKIMPLSITITPSGLLRIIKENDLKMLSISFKEKRVKHQ